MAYFPGVGSSSPYMPDFLEEPQKEPVGGEKAETQKKPRLAVLRSSGGRHGSAEGCDLTCRCPTVGEGRESRDTGPASHLSCPG